MKIEFEAVGAGIVEASLTNDDDRDLGQIARFLLGLSEADLETLHQKFGGLLPQWR
jgi:hypothetical protein